MEKYEIEVEEILQRVIRVEANSLEDAIQIAREQYNNEVIVLNSEDLKETNIREYK